MTHKCKLVKEDMLKRFSRFQRYRMLCPDNPRRWSFFRSDVAVREEQLRHLNTNKYIIHPFSKFKVWYDFYLIFLYCSVLITKPLDSGFISFDAILNYTWYMCYIVLTDLLCWVDIILQFFFGYVHKENNTIELRMSHITRSYLCSIYFAFDVASSIPKPFMILVAAPPLNRYIFSVVGLLGLLKIVRLMSLVRCIGRTSAYRPVVSKGILFLICSVIVSMLIIHWMAALQFAVPRLVRRFFLRGSDERTWYRRQNVINKGLIIQYTHGFFKSSAYILGIRLQIYQAELPEEDILNIITYLVGKILIAFIWIILAVSILNARSMDIKFAEMINQLEEYMGQKQLPLNLRKRILQYFEFKYQKKYFKEQLITSILSESLKRDVNVHVCKSLIRNVVLFSELDTREISKVVEHLIPENFLPHDVIIQAGTHGDTMYFLASGTVAVYTHSGKEVCHLQDGAYFGEICLVLKNHQRSATVIAIETTQVYRLHKKALEKCFLTNKTVMMKIMHNAELRLKETARKEEEFQRLAFEKTYQQSKSKIKW